jgi:hypothetical protein
MPSREDENWTSIGSDLRYCYRHQRYFRAEFGCQLCYLERIGPRVSKGEQQNLLECPSCNQASLFKNNKTEVYECLNTRCKSSYTEEQLVSAVLKEWPDDVRSPEESKRDREHMPSASRVPALVEYTLLLIRRAIRSISGGVLRITKRNIKSLWRGLRRTRALWRAVPKVFIFVAMLAIAAIIVSAVCQFLIADIELYALLGFGIFGLVLVIWGLTSISRYRVTFTRTFLLLLASVIFIISSAVYLGIKTPTDIVDNVKSALSAETEEIRENIELVIERVELQFAEPVDGNDEAVDEAQDSDSNDVDEQFSTRHIHIGGGVLVGADGLRITLQNNSNAVNPSWNELKQFLLSDETDKERYDYNHFVCADFAEMLHNNAEAAGIRSAYVCIQLGPCSNYPYGGGHALNAFETTDRGLVYIDCTASTQSPGTNADKTVEVQVGRDYVPQSIFPQGGWFWLSMGEVEQIETIVW